MEKLTIGTIVLVTFPFSNLKGKKIRPALIVANVEFGNVILCQITSKPYASKTAIRIDSSNFANGSLPMTSFIRPDKLFTADTSIISGIAGNLVVKTKNKVLQKIKKLFSIS